jgi:hypothetical protein
MVNHVRELAQTITGNVAAVGKNVERGDQVALHLQKRPLDDAGQTRYVRTVIGIGFFVGRVYPELVDDATGQKELEDASYIGQPLGQVASSGGKAL